MKIEFCVIKTIVDCMCLTSAIDVPKEILENYKKNDGSYNIEQFLEEVDGGDFKEQLGIDDLASIGVWTFLNLDATYEVEELSIKDNTNFNENI